MAAWARISPRRGDLSEEKVSAALLNKSPRASRLHRSTDLKGFPHYSKATSLYHFLALVLKGIV